VAAAKGPKKGRKGQTPKETPVPRLLSLFWMSQRLNVPLEAGALLDQSSRLQQQALYLDRVYAVVRAWAKGKNLEKEDADLVLRLTQAGMM